jgi:hypothetical protein
MFNMTNVSKHYFNVTSSLDEPTYEHYFKMVQSAYKYRIHMKEYYTSGLLEHNHA